MPRGGSGDEQWIGSRWMAAVSGQGRSAPAGRKTERNEPDGLSGGTGSISTEGLAMAGQRVRSGRSWTMGRVPVIAGSWALILAIAGQPAVVFGQQSAGPSLLPQGGMPQGNIGAPDAVPAGPGVHPLQAALEVAQKGLTSIQANIQDYSATVVKRERIDGKLGEHEYMFAKIRHQPFSVYLFFLGPDAVKGQEVIYVDGHNDGNMLAHAGSGVRAMVGTVSLKPQSMLAMAGQRYPITELGVENLTKRLLEVADHDKQYDECEVNFFPGAKVNGRVCTCIQVAHPVPRKNFRFHLARVFIDDELTIPIRYESYDWPLEPGGQPVLMEEYTYMNVKVNNGFTDADFDPRNTAYKFGAK
jgi:hypothetical protein